MNTLDKLRDQMWRKFNAENPLNANWLKWEKHFQMIVRPIMTELSEDNLLLLSFMSFLGYLESLFLLFRVDYLLFALDQLDQSPIRVLDEGYQ